MPITAYTADGRPKANAQAYAPGGVTFFVWRNASPTAIASGGTVLFDTKLFDSNGWYDATTGRYTPKLPGFYDLTWAVQVATSSTLLADEYITAGLYKNGVFHVSGSPAPQRGTAYAAISLGAANVYANGTTDYFDIRLAHNHASAIQYNWGATYGSNFTGTMAASSIGVAPEPIQIVGVTSGAPAWTNGWNHESPAGGGYQRVGFYKDPNGMVHLQGMASGASATATAAFTLPAGYRPGGGMLFTSKYFPAAANPFVLGEINISSSGGVLLTNTSEAFSANMRWYTIDCHFRAEN